MRDHDGADDAAVPVVDRSSGGFHRNLHAVPSNQHAVGAQADGFVFDNGLHGGAGDLISSRHIDQVEHIVERAAGGFGLRPAGHAFGDYVQVGQPAPKIGAHHGI